MDVSAKVEGHGLDFSGSTYGQMVGTCEQDVEPANAVKDCWAGYLDYVVEVSKEMVHV